MKTMTDPQRRTLFAEIKKAAGELGEDAEDYRKRILKEVLGVDSFSLVSRTDGYNRLMARIKGDLGDYAAAIRFSTGGVRSFRFLIEQKTRGLLGECATAQEVAKYVAGIVCQMGFSRQERDVAAMRLQREDGYEDFTEVQLRKVLSALNAQLHRRRKT